MIRMSSAVVYLVCSCVVFGLAARMGLAAQPPAPNRITGARSVVHSHGQAWANTPRSPAAGNYRVVYSFQGEPDGASPTTALTALNGSIYGTTEQGGRFASGIGPFGAGTVFKIGTSGTESVLHSFGSHLDGASPTSALINVNGVLYGTTLYGGSHQVCVASQDFGDSCYGGGIVYAIDTSGAERVVYSFNSSPNDGAGPIGRLVYANGILYGTTQGGATTNGAPLLSGTLFGVSLRGAERVLYSFGNSPTGAPFPNDLLLVDGAGYGTTYDGGAHGAGTIYEFSSAGEQVLYNFKGGQDGAGPGGLLFANGTFYGTTEQGGAYGHGTVFTFDRLAKRVLYSFKGGSDGDIPNAGLTLANGAFYGTTYSGGAYGGGLVFKLTVSGSESVLHSFGGDPKDGASPSGGLIYDKGALYGTTYQGGSAICCGTVFKLTL